MWKPRWKHYSHIAKEMIFKFTCEFIFQSILVQLHSLFSTVYKSIMLASAKSKKHELLLLQNIDLKRRRKCIFVQLAGHGQIVKSSSFVLQ